MTLFDQLEKKILIILFSEYGNHVTKLLSFIKITKVFKTNDIEQIIRSVSSV